MNEDCSLCIIIDIDDLHKLDTGKMDFKLNAVDDTKQGK